MELHEILFKLIGSTSWAGETNHDNKSYDNMGKLQDVLYQILLLVGDNYEVRERHEASAKMLGKQAEEIYQIIFDTIPYEVFEKLKNDLKESE